MKIRNSLLLDRLIGIIKYKSYNICLFGQLKVDNVNFKEST